MLLPPASGYVSKVGATRLSTKHTGHFTQLLHTGYPRFNFISHNYYFFRLLLKAGRQLDCPATVCRPVRQVACCPCWGAHVSHPALQTQTDAGPQHPGGHSRCLLRQAPHGHAQRATPGRRSNSDAKMKAVPIPSASLSVSEQRN
ncbi:uncharacterized protein LOC126988398 [Eriocheir sinensis]|uniref:uncharacterized protein LOC126988398 n=1 Tax=Eriocheir sinensis TaxID=95602 RepID=UPI0021C90563|nr:uncharacterized protein LOC126988398 [Eriocheir sinensis]